MNLKIYKGGNELYQWDIGVKLIVDDENITRLSFCNGVADCSYYTDVKNVSGQRIAEVPNILLQSNKAIKVYGCVIEGTNTVITTGMQLFRVVGRNKPDSYIYTQEELRNYDDIENRIAKIETDVNTLEALGLGEYAKKSEVAPAGYGLGTVGAMIDNPDNVSKSGFYQFVSDELTGSNVNWYLISQHHNEAYANQIAIHVVYGHEMRRNKIDYTWSPWEWVSPPMQIGQEYRTTERYKGKPVYVLAMDLGAMPNNSEKDVYYPIAIVAANVISFEVMITSADHGARALPSYASDGSLFGYPHLLNSVIRIKTFRDLSAWNGHAIIKYTKD